MKDGYCDYVSGDRFARDVQDTLAAHTADEEEIGTLTSYFTTEFGYRTHLNGKEDLGSTDSSCR